MNPQALATISSLSPLERLLKIMVCLRDARTGCPWDREQTSLSIAPYLLEEAYETVDAIERGDMGALKEELGDVLLQVVFHSQIAQEAGQFDFSEVAEAIATKMLRRHPHVFGQARIASAAEQSTAWEEHKRQERAQKSAHSAMDDVPHAFPALLRAEKLQKRAAKTGFDWPDIAPVMDKVIEEVAEITEVLHGDAEALKEEIGDLLFAVVNLARHAGFSAEEVLRVGNAKFEARFRAMESLAARQNKDFSKLSLEEQEAYWQQVKHAEP